jgi:hypothetical protein
MACTEYKLIIGVIDHILFEKDFLENDFIMVKKIYNLYYKL